MLALLRVLLDDPTQPRYGLELSKQAGVRHGTIYPALARLETVGWLTHEWEDVDPHTEGRPRRKLYRLTGQGELAARRTLEEEIARLRAPEPALGWLGNTGGQPA